MGSNSKVRLFSSGGWDTSSLNCTMSTPHAIDQGCHANVMVTTTISSVIIFFIGTCYRGCLCSSQAKHRTPDKKSCTKRNQNVTNEWRINKTCSRFPIDKDDFWLCSQMCVKSSQCTSAARRKAGAPWSGPASTLDRNGASARFFVREGLILT